MSKNPVAAQGIANFKKWSVSPPSSSVSRVFIIPSRHGLHVGALRHAAICAFNLGHNPTALEDGVLFVEVKLKSDHKDFHLKRKYEPTGGFTLTMKETHEMLGNIFDCL
jgi:hypothetical protein